MWIKHFCTLTLKYLWTQKTGSCAQLLEMNFWNLRLASILSKANFKTAANFLLYSKQKFETMSKLSNSRWFYHEKNVEKFLIRPTGCICFVFLGNQFKLFIVIGRDVWKWIEWWSLQCTEQNSARSNRIICTLQLCIVC